MSCYNWESGTIKIPSKEWKRLRDSIVRAASDRNARVYAMALKIHAGLKDKALRDKAKAMLRDSNKGKPKAERVPLRDLTPLQLFIAVNGTWDGNYRLRNLFDKAYGFDAIKIPDRTVRRAGYFGASEERNEDWYDTYMLILDALFPFHEKGARRTSPQKPKKKDFPKLASTKVKTLTADEARLSFNHIAKSVTWSVNENNRAVESARRTWLAQALFSALDRVAWTRGSGGKIIGNDEYNRDSDYEGGGGNYVTKEYGPNVKTPTYY